MPGGRPREKKFVKGEKYGRLTLVKEIQVGERRFVECLCDCKNKKTIFLHSILHGLTKSCGCIKREAGERYNRLLPFTRKIKDLLKYAFREVGSCKDKRSSFDLLPYSREDLFNHLQPFLGRECSVKLKCQGVILSLRNSHLDHIIPIATAITEEDVIKLNLLENLRLICGPCNQSKWAKIL